MAAKTMTAYRFRDFLLDYMKQHNLSARELARRIDVAPSTVTRAIDGHAPQMPGFDFILKTSKATGASVAALIELAYPDVIEASRVSASAQLMAQQIEKLPEHEREIIRRIIRGSQE